MSRLPLHVLPTFCTVARLANLRAAADELHLTHSAVSQQIKLLEDTLGVTLFERRGRSIEPNEQAILLQHFVQAAFDELDVGGFRDCFGVEIALYGGNQRFDKGECREALDGYHVAGATA